ncbi:hypothetical protein AcV5_006621 [Taiwanofungus camphoratus]|nr:hypothetical protein AcV5_006621 [Antrodia cinnamomea]
MLSLLPLLASAVLSWAPLTLPAAAQSAAAVAYAPTLASCPPGTSLVREAGATNQTLSAAESAYVSARQSDVLPAAWRAYLASVLSSTHGLLDLPPYVFDILSGARGAGAYPTFGIATSGGGYRAAIFGAGVLNALDGRNATSVRAGTGGLLQAATYLAGLSGGGWLVTSLSQADFPTLRDLIFRPADACVDEFGGWLAQINLLEPSANSSITEEYYVELVEELVGKAKAGYPVTITDVWARAISRHFVNGTNAADSFNSNLTHGAGLTFSSISNVGSFATYNQPFPIVIADSLSPNGNSSNILNGSSNNVVPLTNPIYEFTVFEVGSYDPMLAAFTPTKYLGSPNSSLCATGFDQMSFVEGLSSNLFNTYNTSTAAFKASPVGPILEILTDIIPEPGLELDTALVPNPFFGLSPGTFIDANETLLKFVDGGEDGETVPFQPLLVKARGVDVIFGIDAASDTADYWADGSSIIATQERVSFFPGTYAFPPVPTNQSTFLALNLTTRPAFFGCGSALSAGAPLVVYLANGGAPLGQAPLTNTSTDQFAYAADALDAMLAQTFDVATQGIPVAGMKDPAWPACLACAVVDRARARAGLERGGVCETCMERYCWS